MSAPTLTFATARRYDTKFLLDGTVRVRDYDIKYHDAGAAPWPVFRDMVNSIPYDIGEQAFSHYLIAKDLGKPLTAIAAFPSRFFPQLGVVVHEASGIKEPLDLVGKRVGVPGFGYNPAVWMRGILVHQYDVPVEQVIWVEDSDDQFFGGLNYPRSRRFKIETAGGLGRQLLGSAGTTGAMGAVTSVESGTIDALMAPGGGPPLSGMTRKLFADPLDAVRTYVHSTSVFPINTVITIRTDVVERHPDLPRRLMEALSEARRLYNQEVLASPEADHMGFPGSFARELRLFPDSYGVGPNLPAIRMMIHYCYEQGLITRLYSPEELFAA